MKATRMRFTTRRMMIAVAAAALLAWPATMALRWDDYRRRAAHHDEVARVLSSEIIALRRQGGQEREAKFREGVMIEESRMAGAYLRAMQRPWGRVGPGEGEGEPRPRE